MIICEQYSSVYLHIIHLPQPSRFRLTKAWNWLRLCSLASAASPRLACRAITMTWPYLAASLAMPGLHFQLLLQALDVGTQLSQAPLSERPQATLSMVELMDADHQRY